MRPSLATLSVLALLLAGCRQTPSSGSATASPPSGRAPDTASVGPVSTDPLSLKFHKVDMLIAQWDVSQSEGHTAQADALFQTIRQEVDQAFPDFVRISKGAAGPNLQYLGVSALGFSARPEATTALMDRLGDRDPSLLGNALIALKLRADPDTPLGPILHQLGNPAPLPRRYAPLALANVVEAQAKAGRTIDPGMQQKALQLLSGMVADRDPFVRLHVAKALGALRSPAAYELLMIEMKDDEERIRLAAAAGLERIADPRGFPEVIRLLDEASDPLKPAVRDLLASYAQRMQGQPLSSQQVQSMGTSPTAWTRWFNGYRLAHGIQLDQGRDPGLPQRMPPAGAPGPMPVRPPAGS